MMGEEKKELLTYNGSCALHRRYQYSIIEPGQLHVLTYGCKVETSHQALLSEMSQPGVEVPIEKLLPGVLTRASSV